MRQELETSYKLNIFIPLAISVIFIVFGLFFTVHLLQHQAIDKDKSVIVDKFYKALENELKHETEVIEHIIKHLSEQEEIKKLYLERDREELYKHLKSEYKYINSHLDITHLYFIDKNSSVFLRVHKKEKFGDKIDRFTFREARILEETFSGVEFGVLRNYTLRVVYPWKIDGKIIGYIEMGKEIDKIITFLSKQLDSEIYLFIQEDIYRDIENSFLQIGNYVIPYKTYELPTDVLKKVLKQEHYQFEIENRYFYPFSSPLYDSSQKELGFVLFLVDASFEHQILSFLMKFLFISGAFVVIIILSIGFWLIRKKEVEINRLANNLKNMAVKDELTTLFNRKCFNYQAPLELSEAKRDKKMISMLMVDIDYFKLYNDTYGHQAGDEVLKEVARTIKKVFQRSGDLSFRLGGEEFAILFKHLKHEDISIIAEKLRSSIEELQIEHKKNEISDFVTVSIGVATVNVDDDISIEKLYKFSDSVLYKSKTKGRNRVSFFNGVMEKELSKEPI
jgi:diguanylate cyclase (GGDEF)-like protein